MASRTPPLRREAGRNTSLSASCCGPAAMGWGNGAGKREVLDPAGGGLRSCDSDGSPFEGKDVLIDVSGVAHKASKRGCKSVVLHGTSDEQQEYVRTLVIRYMELESEHAALFPALATCFKLTREEVARIQSAQHAHAQRSSLFGRAWSAGTSIVEAATQAARSTE